MCNAPQQYLLTLPQQVENDASTGLGPSAAAAAVAATPTPLLTYASKCPICTVVVAFHRTEGDEPEGSARPVTPKGLNSLTKSQDAAFVTAMAKQNAANQLQAETSAKKAQKMGALVAMLKATLTAESRESTAPGLSIKDRVLLLTTASPFSVGSAEDRLLKPNQADAMLAKWFPTYPGHIDLNAFLDLSGFVSSTSTYPSLFKTTRPNSMPLTFMFKRWRRCCKKRSIFGPKKLP